jgi:hypothetical protein
MDATHAHTRTHTHTHTKVDTHHFIQNTHARMQDPELAELLQLPQHIQEGATRDAFARVFEAIDADRSSGITWEEFKWCVPHVPCVECSWLNIPRDALLINHCIITRAHVCCLHASVLCSFLFCP